MSEIRTEWWQRGPVEGVPALLQPVAHILLEVRDNVPTLVEGLAPDAWNARPAGVASVAFHIRHIAGVIDRLFTYARGDHLSQDQLAVLRAETAVMAADEVAPALAVLDAQIASAIDELRTFAPATLGDFRGVGRANLPSTVIGCLIHAAEHAMRHVGQLSVTVRIIRRSE